MDIKSQAEPALQPDPSALIAGLGDRIKFVDFIPHPQVIESGSQGDLLERLRSSSPSWQAGYPRLSMSKFGPDFSPKLWQVMEKAQDLINDLNMLELCKIEYLHGQVILTMANVWRVCKNISGKALSYFEFCPETNKWIPQQPALMTWEKPGELPWEASPEISYRGGSGGYEPLTGRFWSNIFAFEIRIPARIKRIEATYSYVPPLPIAYEVSKYALGKSGFYDLYALESRKYDNKNSCPFRHVYYELASFFSGLLNRLHGDGDFIRKMLYEHFIDRPLLNIVCTKYSLEPVSIGQYLQALPHAKSLARIARESRNFLPMLNVIPSKFWSRRDLLKGSTLKLCHPALAEISSSGLKWLRQAPSSVLSNLWHLYYFYPVPVLARTVHILSNLNVGPKIPNSVIHGIISHASEIWSDKHNRSPQDYDRMHPQIEMNAQNKDSVAFATRLFRLYALHCLGILKEKGRKTLWRYSYPDNIDHDELWLVVDWFAAEGAGQKFPNKYSTWSSLVSLAEIWRDCGGYDEGDEQCPDVVWKSVFNKPKVDGISVRPLTSPRDLITEGHQMHHCVGRYWENCLCSDYQIFSLKKPNGLRSTLLLTFEDEWEVGEHYGPCNQSVSQEAEMVAQKIVSHLNSEGVLPPPPPEL